MLHRCMSRPISIHAPARGASLCVPHTRHVVSFQFTPLREGLQRVYDLTSSAKEFQFTPLREGLPPEQYGAVGDGTFQFTPLREGLRKKSETVNCTDSISIHAPARGASIPIQKCSSTHTDFNSRPCERGFNKVCQY